MKAAKVLNCSAMELADREDYRDWMIIAQTVEQGEQMGEWEREIDPGYQRELKKAAETIQRARGRR